MKVIREKDYEGRRAQLMVSEDHTVVSVLFDKEVLFECGGNAWNNIEEAEWMQEATMDLWVEDRLKKERADCRLSRIAKELGRCSAKMRYLAVDRHGACI